MDLRDHVGGELFGRAARLRVALWVNGAEGAFWQQQVAEGARVRPQYVKSELVHLVRLGMVEELRHDDPADRRNYYAKVDGHPLWAVIEAAEGALRRLEGEPVSERTLRPV
jgi:hypothetical protein